jgi:predicted RNase H-like nuclease (RuvC/YqgF family)|nr:MAG TPA: hypothetical protein [Caudoviricetes sp.]
MKVKNLKINFRYLGGNIACLSVDNIDGKSVHNDINNEEAIIIFNSLIGEKENCKTIKSLLKENQDLKKQLEGKEDYIKKLQATKDKLDKWDYENTIQQKEFIKYLGNKITELLNEYCNYAYDDYSKEQGKYDTYIEVLQRYKKIIEVEK